jgi:hypothetical protein
MHDLRLLRLPLEGKLAAEQADEVEVFIFPSSGTAYHLHSWGKAKKVG